MKKDKYTVCKYDGDDEYSYAVFKNLPTGLGRPICYGQAKPVVAGCSKSQADSYKRQYEKR
jgi:hypothetical protein